MPCTPAFGVFLQQSKNGDGVGERGGEQNAFSVCGRGSVEEEWGGDWLLCTELRRVGKLEYLPLLLESYKKERCGLYFNGYFFILFFF